MCVFVFVCMCVCVYRNNLFFGLFPISWLYCCFCLKRAKQNIVLFRLLYLWLRIRTSIFLFDDGFQLSVYNRWLSKMILLLHTFILWLAVGYYFLLYILLCMALPFHCCCYMWFLASSGAVLASMMDAVSVAISFLECIQSALNFYCFLYDLCV